MEQEAPSSVPGEPPELQVELLPGQGMLPGPAVTSHIVPPPQEPLSKLPGY